MKYQYPDDVERFMDQFIEDNPKANWREVVREFEKAMLTSMKVGGDLYERFTPEGGEQNDRRDQQ